MHYQSVSVPMMGVPPNQDLQLRFVTFDCCMKEKCRLNSRCAALKNANEIRDQIRVYVWSNTLNNILDVTMFDCIVVA